jgi:S-DNA-T family DNA segregation ATPase FtsK/SpoIIIE
MIAPVITEPHGAYAALQWLVKEMQVRYEILKQMGLRNITAFNSRKIDKQLEASLNIPIPEHMPFIVAIIDEFADLMMVSSADIETPIARIAQMARAVGIHLILATQRPSREVITGIIKANVPTRISFKVASRINSQIILDEVGAESLLGNGDLLFLPPGSSQLVRAQGVYVSDADINQVVNAICEQGPPNYLIPSFDSFKALDLGPDKEEPKGNDPLYDQALTLVVSSKSASTTFLQRKLKIGYARAASLMDELEQNGIISAQDGAKPRRVIGGGAVSESPLEDDEEELP